MTPFTKCPTYICMAGGPGPLSVTVSSRVAQAQHESQVSFPDPLPFPLPPNSPFPHPPLHSPNSPPPPPLNRSMVSFMLRGIRFPPGGVYDLLGDVGVGCLRMFFCFLLLYQYFFQICDKGPWLDFQSGAEPKC